MFRTAHGQFFRRKSISPERFEIEAYGLTHKIKIVSRTSLDSYLKIPLPMPDGGDFYNNETLFAQLEVELFERRGLFGWNKIAQLSSAACGMEYGTRHEDEV